MLTITDNMTDPQYVDSGNTITPFGSVTVSDSIAENETVQVSLGYYGYPSTGIGSLTDPMGGGTYDPTTQVFTETGPSNGNPTFATQLLHRLVYTAPVLQPGQPASVTAHITVSGGDGEQTSDPVWEQINTLSAPAIEDTVANQPVRAPGTINPFATVNVGIADNYMAAYSYPQPDTATITVTDAGVPTDADGLLTGIGLSKTGVGTYALPDGSNWSLQNRLSQLAFAPNAVPAGQTRTTNFELTVTDSQSGLSGTDTTTSVLALGPSTPAVTPSPANGMNSTPLTASDQATLNLANSFGQQVGAAAMTFIDGEHVGADFSNLGEAAGAGQDTGSFSNQLWSDLRAFLTDWNTAQPGISAGISTPLGPTVSLPAQFVLNLVNAGLQTIAGSASSTDQSFGSALSTYFGLNQSLLLNHTA